MIEVENYSESDHRYIIRGEQGFIVAQDASMLELFRHVNRLASVPTTVLLRGESGTGKELFAKALHYNGTRADKNLVVVTTTNIPSELLESELFGFKQGAFTGASKDSVGKFVHAHGGTIFLDEIGDMSPTLQAKILRVLQEREITPVGAIETRAVDVRIVAATHQDLEAKVRKGEFREDLYYRLNVYPLPIPALMDRKGDIPLVAAHLIEKNNRLYGARVEGLSQGAAERLVWHDWPGNVRELENVMERVFVVRDEGFVQPEDLVFDRRVLKRVTIKLAKEEESGKPKLWYESGVLPVSPVTIVGMEGGRSSPYIRKMEADGLVYSEQISRGAKIYQVLFVTPQNAGLFFANTDTQDFRELVERVKANEFNQIVAKPFKIFTYQSLMATGYSYGSVASIDKAIEASKAYRVKYGSITLFVVTEDIAEHFVSSRGDRAVKIDALKADIRGSYERFQQWTPRNRS